MFPIPGNTESVIGRYDDGQIGFGEAGIGKVVDEMLEDLTEVVIGLGDGLVVLLVDSLVLMSRLL